MKLCRRCPSCRYWHSSSSGDLCNLKTTHISRARQGYATKSRRVAGRDGMGGKAGNTGRKYVYPFFPLHSSYSLLTCTSPLQFPFLGGLQSTDVWNRTQIPMRSIAHACCSYINPRLVHDTKGPSESYVSRQWCRKTLCNLFSDPLESHHLQLHAFSISAILHEPGRYPCQRNRATTSWPQ